MRKKFLSALLFGVVLTTATGTFVSCKDYDDDIDNLQEQINKLATADELKASVSDLNAAISAAKSEAEAKAAAAQATADAAKQGADAAAAKVAELEANGATKAEVEAAQEVANAAKTAADNAAAAAAEAAGKIAAQATEITALANRIQTLEDKIGGMTNEAIEADITELQEAVEEIKAEMEKLGVTTASVTAVSLYTGSGEAKTVKVDFTRATEQDNTFGPNGDWTFTKGNVKTYAPEPIIVRVSPTTADLRKANISLINSQGAALSYVSVDKVEPYTDLMSTGTRAAGDNNGLWKVTFKLQENLDAKAFSNAVKTKVDNNDEDICFAVAVSNTNDVEGEAERRVISAYEVTVDAGEATQVAPLDFTVDGKSVAEIHNRYKTSSSDITKLTTELKWINDKAATSAVRKDPTTDNPINVTRDTGDNRQSKDSLRVELNKDITIAINVNTDGKVIEPIKGFYVTLDTEYADQSGVSEINAWNSYSYNGVYTTNQSGTMFEGNTGKIRINNLNNVLSDVIGFRVYAVNLDGTLVDPDGKAFYVHTANPNGEVSKAANLAIASNGTDFVGYAAFTKADGLGSNWITALKGASWKASGKDAAGKERTFSVDFVDNNYATTTNADNVAYVKFTIANSNAKNFIDGATYTQSFTYVDGVNSKTYTFSATKVMPEVAPKGFTAKDQQIINGVYTCYLMPEGGNDDYEIQLSTPANGIMDLQNAFNGLNNAAGDNLSTEYSFSFANSKKKSDNSGWDPANVIASGTTGKETYVLNVVAIDVQDNKTQHATTVQYNYGEISLAPNKDGVYVTGDCKVNVLSFNTVYACWHHAQGKWNFAGYSYSSVGTDGRTTTTNVAATTSITYARTGFKLDARTIKGQNSYNNSLFGRTLDEMCATLRGTHTSTSAKNYLKVVSAKLTTDATGEEEYFTVGADLTFAPLKTGAGSNPAGDVASTLTINCKDCFDHDVVITLPFTVKKQ